MKRKYFLNLTTGTYHIKGYCRDSKVVPSNAKEFRTEEEVISYGARSIKFCKNCSKKLNQLLDEESK